MTFSSYKNGYCSSSANVSVCDDFAQRAAQSPLVVTLEWNGTPTPNCYIVDIRPLTSFYPSFTTLRRADCVGAPGSSHILKKMSSVEVCE